MDRAELREGIKEGIARGASLSELREVLVAYAADGGTKDVALEALNALLADAKDDTEDDQIRDVMDLVVGFCAPSMRVW